MSQLNFNLSTHVSDEKKNIKKTHNGHKIETFVRAAHMGQLQIRASGRFSFHFREVYKKCIEYIGKILGKILIQMREISKFL